MIILLFVVLSSSWLWAFRWPNGYNQGMDMNYGQQGLQNHAMAGPATNGMYAGQQNGSVKEQKLRAFMQNWNEFQFKHYACWLVRFIQFSYHRRQTEWALQEGKYIWIFVCSASKNCLFCSPTTHPENFSHIPSMNSMNSMNSSTSYSNYQSNTTTNKPYQQQQSQPYLNGTMPPPTRPNGAIPSGNGSNGGGNGTNPSDPSMFYYSPSHNQQNSQANRMPPQQQINGWGDFWWSARTCISACVLNEALNFSYQFKTSFIVVDLNLWFYSFELHLLFLSSGTTISTLYFRRNLA